MTTGDSYPDQSDKVPSDLSGVWQDLAYIPVQEPTPKEPLPPLGVTSHVEAGDAPKEPLPPLGEEGAEDIGSRSLTSGTELKNYTKESASAAIERIFNGFCNGDINPYNLKNAISDVLGTHDKSSVTDFAVLLAIGSALDEHGRHLLFSQAIDPDPQVTPKAVSETTKIISSNGSDIDNGDTAQVYQSLISTIRHLGHLGDSTQVEVEALIRVFGVGRILNSRDATKLGIDSEVMQAVNAVRLLESTTKPLV